MGMHEGHAIEAMITGLCHRINDKKKLEWDILHQDPDIPITMDTDVVIKERGTLRAIIMICHSDNRDYSHRKVKRTREEFNQIRQLKNTAYRQKLSTQFRVINLVAGMNEGWHQSQLDYMNTEIFPTMYLPDLLGASLFKRLIDVLMIKYTKSNNLASRKRTVMIEARQNPATFPGLEKIEKNLSRLLMRAEYKNVDIPPPGSQALVEEEGVSLAPSPFSSRYRQGLSVLSSFPLNELGALYELMESGDLDWPQCSGTTKSAALRARWLGFVDIEESLDGSIAIALKRRNGPEEMDCSQPFDDLSPEEVRKIIERLVVYSKQELSTFAGGIQVLAIANYQLVIKRLAVLLDKLGRNVEAGQKSAAVASLIDDAPVLPVDSCWPTSKSIYCFRSFFSSFFAVHFGDNSYLSKQGFDFSRNERLSNRDAEEIYRLVESDMGVKEELDRVRLFCESYARAKDDVSLLFSKEVLKFPDVFDIRKPGSWLQRQYFVLTSHAAFNPLMVLNYEMVAKNHYGDGRFCGFPKRLFCSLRDVIGGNAKGRFRLVRLQDKKLHAYEANTITANNIGNKTKELFDRIGECRRSLTGSGYSLVVHGLFDGDFGEEVIASYLAEGRYDEFLSIKEVVSEFKAKGFITSK